MSQTERRQFLKQACRGAALVGITGLSVFLGLKKPEKSVETVWQIDPARCTACGACSHQCVQTISAVRCFHNFAMCGYCDLCTGFFDPQPIALNAGAENQLCPTDAIRRRLVEEPYYEYVITRERCIGCGKCVYGCTALGNGSLYLQIDQKICEQCNQCAIALQCPAEAIHRVPAETAYLLKK